MNRPIVVVNSSAEVGGAELSLLPVVQELAREHEVKAFLPGPGPLGELLRELGVELVSGFELGAPLLRASRQYGTRAKFRLGPAVFAQQLRFARALARVRPAALYCNGFRAQLGATAAAAVLRVPTVWHVRDFIPRGASARAFALLAKRASAIVANSRAVAAQPALAGVSVRVIENGIDLSRFRPRGFEPGNPFVLGMVAHLTPWKGHERFLKILESARGAFPGTIGRIAGADIYDTAEHHAYAARVAKRVEELGPTRCTLEAVSQDRMPAWLGELTVLIHCPDRPEPFGRSLAEALATGVPVVATAAGGAPDVVGDAGVLVEQGDDGRFADAVIELLRDAEARAVLARVGVERARARFDERRYARETAHAVVAVVRS
jgi:glycosyltransferase involved in cell wall biosynthesis